MKTIGEIHPSLLRLFEVAGTEKKGKIAFDLNVGASTVTNWSNRGVSKEGALLAGDLYNCDPNYILEGKGVAVQRPRDGQTLESMNIRPVVDMDETDLDDDEFEYPNYREVFVSGGSKELPVLETDTEPCKMKKEIARRAGADMEHTFGYTLEGDSMYPKILDKAHCVGDSSKKQVKDGKIYCFRHGVMRRTKYLFNRPDGGLLIRSENREEYPDEIIKPEDMYDIEILGWVYNWCNTEIW